MKFALFRAFEARKIAKIVTLVFTLRLQGILISMIVFNGR